MLPQTGIFAVGLTSHGWAELDLVPGVDASDVLGVLADLAERETTMGATNLVVAVRPEVWAAAVPGTSPHDLAGFDEPVTGPDGFVMPATQHDVALWFAAASYDLVFDGILGAVRALDGLAELRHELRGWTYHRDRDLTGFEDGTENPTLVRAPGVALVPEGSPGAGGSVLLLQQWSHDPGWLGLDAHTQEAVMGRTKGDSTELDDKPETSHVARTDQDELGDILRRNVAYGTVSDHGTIFVGFAASRDPLHRMLASMAGVAGPRDALTRWSTPVTGAYYWVPGADDLAAHATTADD